MTTEIESNPNDFFVAGGTLRASAPSYVLRPADEELFEMAVQGAFCYVLTPRQMGKSSLMIRTAKRLGEQGIRAGIVDLTQIGAKVTVEQWYLGLLSQLRRSLKLETDYAEWWSAHSALGEVQRFTDFLREVVLSEINGRVVIFIDEIDSTLQLDFRDDFFAAIRAMYNARAETADFGRLSFVLLGVASPPDLIRDLTRTPFNIGQAIALKEFSRADAAVLQAELEKQFPDKGEAIFERIFYWTNGHPYLTQKLCLTIAEKPQAIWGDAEVDALVGEMFLTEEARKESNLEFVQNNILSHSLKLSMLKLYRDVAHGVVVSENQTPVQNQLKLSGLIKAEGGALQVRNRVYGQVFDGDWVQANIPVNWTRWVAVTAIAMLALFIGLFVYFFVESTYVMPNRVRLATADFFQKPSSKDRIAALATIVRSKGAFDVKNNNDSAIELFYTLSQEDKLRLFDPYESREVGDEELITVIKTLYVTLADVDELKVNLGLLENIYRSLEKREEGNETKKLRDEIKFWIDGITAGDTATAETAYVAASKLNSRNPAVQFALGRLYTKLNRFDEALVAFNEVVLIAQELATTTKTIEPTTTITPVASEKSILQATISASTQDTPTVEPTIAATPSLRKFLLIEPRFTTSGQIIGVVRSFTIRNLLLLDQLATSPITSNVPLRNIFFVNELNDAASGYKYNFPDRIELLERGDLSVDSRRVFLYSGRASFEVYPELKRVEVKPGDQISVNFEGTAIVVFADGLSIRIFRDTQGVTFRPSDSKQLRGRVRRVLVTPNIVIEPVF
jgi:AAA-like domain